MKEAGTQHWLSPNIGADNSSGFSALPGGYRMDFDGSFIGVKNSANWWSFNPLMPILSMKYSINNFSAALDRTTTQKKAGYSIRCVKD